MDKLSFVEDKYIFINDILSYTITDKAYAEPLFAKIREFAKIKGYEKLPKILDTLCSSLDGKIRKSNHLDSAMIKTFGSVKDVKREYGTKHNCKKCSIPFFDLNKPDKTCPHCDTPVSKTDTP